MERLNPVCEQPPVWVMTERGDTQPLPPPKQRMQLVATFTPPSRHGSREVGVQGSELSPALANRFRCIHMDDPADPEACTDAAFGMEVAAICKVLCSDQSDTEPDLAAAVLCALRGAVCGACGASAHAQGGPHTRPHLTLRNYVCILDGTFHLHRRNPRLSFSSCLHLAFTWLLRLPQLEGNPFGEQAEQAVLAALGSTLDSAATPTDTTATTADQPWSVHQLVAAEGHSAKMLGAHVLMPSRLGHTEALVVCLMCGVAALLEGPAAVGKTSLVAALASALYPGKRLLRINNSDSTTPQDYLGNFLPDGSGRFEHKPGPLAVAMREGHPLLIDEINLAPAPVLSLLAPLLDGHNSLQVPGTDLVLLATPGFCIVATGNSAAYAGRKALPMSLRNRFQVGRLPCTGHASSDNPDI